MSASTARGPADPRISRRRKAVERSRRRRLLWRLAVVAVVAVAVWGLFFSPLLQVRHVRVVGARHTTPAQIARAAGLDSSDNLLLLSPSAIGRDAARLPWVKDVEVHRKLPGTVKVSVIERIPSMVVDDGSRAWEVDRDGTVLGTSDGARALPSLSGFPLDDLQIGDKVASDEVLAALATYRSMPAPLRRAVVEASAPTLERLTFSLRDGTQVRYGPPQELDAKNEVLRVVLQRLRAQGVEGAYIDVRVPGHPAVSEAPGVTIEPTPSPIPTPGPTPASTP